MLQNESFLKFFVRLIIAFALAALLCCKSKAQERNEEEEVFHHHHSLALVISHAQVFEGRNDNGEKETLSLPAWGIDYSYWFRSKWAIGLHTDVIIEKFKVKGENGSGIERSFPIAPAFMGIYKPCRHWSFLLGMGEEFAKEENFGLTRVGIEYGGELPKNWEVFGTLNYDFKWKAYDTWAIGIGIAKLLGAHKHGEKK